MRVFLEILRIIILFALLGMAGWVVLAYTYDLFEVKEAYRWSGSLAVVILLFVLYRNKLQFSGWYKGKGKVKLPKTLSIVLILISIILLILPLLVEAF